MFLMHDLAAYRVIFLDNLAPFSLAECEKLFEIVCLNHINQIKATPGISGIETRYYEN